MSWQDTIKAAHLAVTDEVSHYWRLRSDRYFVWAEDSANDLIADDRHTARAVTGTTDLYTKIEDDPWREELERQFDIAGISWYRSSVQFEDETGYIHTEWVWEVLDTGENTL